MQMRKEVRTLRCIKQLLAEKNSLLTGKDRRIVVQDELKRLGVGELERVHERPRVWPNTLVANGKSPQSRAMHACMHAPGRVASSRGGARVNAPAA